MENSTTITETSKFKKDRYMVRVETNPFHPEGGGQPGDTGRIWSETFKGLIVACRKDHSGKYLEVVPEMGYPMEGEQITLYLDEHRHSVLTRSHTAQHIFSRILEDSFPGLSTGKVNIHEVSSTVYFDFDGELKLEDIFRAEAQVNEVIKADMKVETLCFTYDEARQVKGVKAKWELLSPEDDVQVVKIGEMDLNACAGTHVRNTKEIHGFIVCAFRGSRPHWEVKYSIDKDEICMGHSRILREVEHETGVKGDELLKSFSNLKEENIKLKKEIRKLGPHVKIPWIREEGQNYHLYAISAEELPRDVLMQASKRKTMEDPRSIVLVLLPETGKTQLSFILRKGGNVELNLSELIDQLPELQCKGGGKGDFFSGVTQEGLARKWINAILSHL